MRQATVEEEVSRDRPSRPSVRSRSTRSHITNNKAGDRKAVRTLADVNGPNMAAHMS